MAGINFALRRHDVAAKPASLLYQLEIVNRSTTQKLEEPALHTHCRSSTGVRCRSIHAYPGYSRGLSTKKRAYRVQKLTPAHTPCRPLNPTREPNGQLRLQPRMVLLTSSAISGLISSVVVCIFTFLLFLSGYVLQQQSVRSLQEALRRPPEPKPRPTLPPAFHTAATTVEAWQGIPATGIPTTVMEPVDVVVTAVEISAAIDGQLDVQVGAVDFDQDQDIMQTRIDRDRALQIPVDSPAQTLPLPSPLDESRARLPSSSENGDNSPPQTPRGQSTAYILSLLDTKSLCSALLFSKHHTQHTNLPAHSRPSIILLYPSTWETYPDPSSISALTLLRSAIDSPLKAFGHLILHPVQISVIWSGPGMLEGQLLAELQRGRFTYDRMLYLRLPGLAVDIPTLDAALSTSDLRRSWSPLSSVLPSSSHGTSGGTISPPVLLVSPTKGLLAPRSGLRHLTMSVSTSHANHHENEMEVEAKAASKGSAWVLFDEAELEHRRNEKEWYGGLVERFERGRREVCLDSGLLEG